jgi:hypothetical protein
MVRKRVKLLGLLIFALGITAFAAVPGVAVAEESAPEVPPVAESAPESPPAEGLAPLDASCNSGNVCVWTETGYNGAKGESLCTGGPHPLAGWKYSVKNRCANKASWLRINGVSNMCINPGGESSGTFQFNELWIGAEGSRC